jgi:hypothetical protein
MPSRISVHENLQYSILIFHAYFQRRFEPMFGLLAKDILTKRLNKNATKCFHNKGLTGLNYPA